MCLFFFNALSFLSIQRMHGIGNMGRKSAAVRLGLNLNLNFHDLFSDSALAAGVSMFSSFQGYLKSR